MSFSACPHCKGSYFECVEQSPSGSNFKVNFVQCSGCGAPFGTMDFYNLGALLKKQEKAIENVGSRLLQIENAINQMAYNLNKLR
jgi:hypothetical protein